MISELELHFMALNEPDELLKLLENHEQLPTVTVAFAAENAGYINNPDAVIPLLTNLLKHPQAIVREAALYGLDRYDLPGEVIELISDMSTHDRSKTVREVAAQSIEIQEDFYG